MKVKIINKYHDYSCYLYNIKRGLIGICDGEHHIFGYFLFEIKYSGLDLKDSIGRGIKPEIDKNDMGELLVIGVDYV